MTYQVRSTGEYSLEIFNSDFLNHKNEVNMNYMNIYIVIED